MTEKRLDRPRAAVAGCYSIDICPGFAGTGKDFGEIIKPGAITRITGNDMFPGGSAPNTGLAMNIFGVEPVFLGKIGNDAFGGMLLDMMRAQLAAGSDSDADDGDGQATAGSDAALEALCVDENAPTAYSLILAPKGLDRAILQNPGANDEFCFDDIDWEKLSGCRLLHFGHPPTIRRFYEDEGAQLRELFRTARERGMATSLDLCAVDPASDAAKEDWRKILENVLPYVDFFLPSAVELDQMLHGAGIAGSGPLGDGAGKTGSGAGRTGSGEAAAEILAYGTDDELHDAVRKLAEESVRIGASNLVIKLGSRGFYYRNADDLSAVAERLGRVRGAEGACVQSRADAESGGQADGLANAGMDDWAGREGFAPARSVEEVSGLGAGDTFIGAYLAGLLRGFGFDATIECARAEGALCVTQRSATGGLVPFERLSGLFGDALRIR